MGASATLGTRNAMTVDVQGCAPRVEDARKLVTRARLFFRTLTGQTHLRQCGFRFRLGSFSGRTGGFACDGLADLSLSHDASSSANEPFRHCS